MTRGCVRYTSYRDILLIIALVLDRSEYERPVAWDRPLQVHYANENKGDRPRPFGGAGPRPGKARGSRPR